MADCGWFVALGYIFVGGLVGVCISGRWIFWIAA